MALTDIDFCEADGGDFLLERPVGTLNAPVDILTEAGGSYVLLETEAVPNEDIFIIND